MKDVAQVFLIWVIIGGSSKQRTTGLEDNNEFCLGHTGFGATMKYPHKRVSKFLDMSHSEQEYLS